MLNAALATEIVCYLRYKRHYFMASGMNAKSAAADASIAAARSNTVWRPPFVEMCAPRRSCARNRK